MRKNWLAAVRARWFRAEPLVPDANFQGASEPYPAHWRRFPQPWPDDSVGRPEPRARTPEQVAALDAALADLPELWRRVLIARVVARGDDQQVADELDLTLDQVRDILARARAAVRDRLDRILTDGPK
jgi:RNA polymerase sigma-70 factor (ECF subfamily)